MNLLAASTFSDYLRNIFTDWVIALFIFFSILILLAAIFKGPKVAIILLTVAVVIAGGFVLAAFIMMLVSWDSLQLIDFAIRWLPTVLFVFIILVSTLVNAKRGLRKSLILLAHSVGACAVCIAFFYLCVNSEWVDRTILSAINGVLGGNSLQSMLGVSAGCTTLREILVEYLPNMIGGDMQVLLAQNPQYILSLADMGFRIVFAVLTLLLYFFLIFIMYIIYLCAYSERKHREKVNAAVEENKTHRPYKKHHKSGGLVGLVRGIAVGLLSLSFLGSAFFIVAGGKGYGTMADYDLGNDEYNFYYSIYRSIESYGSQGIFKILNLMNDPSDTPFYLFAADMVLSGNLDNEENEINNQNIKFREELAAFLGFAKDTMNLLMKYGESDIVAILNGANNESAFDTVVNIMTIPEFRTEFDLLIEEFDSQTYVVNLGMSLVNSIVDNVDNLEFTSEISEDNKELMKVLFKKGHLSDEIPDEHKLKEELGHAALTSTTERPRIKVSHLLNKKDVRIILQVAFSFLAGEVETESTVEMVKTLLPDFKQLSILETSRAKEMDPVLARLYCYLENRYLTAEGEEGRTYKAVEGKNVRWLDEINVLLDVAGDSLALWDNIYAEEGDVRDLALSIFDMESPNYDVNVKYYDDIRFALERSDIIGLAMSTSYLYEMLKEAFLSVSENMYIPENIVYTRTLNADGKVVTMGEMYYFLGGFRLFNAPENRPLAMRIMSEEATFTVDMLDDLSVAAATSDDDGVKLSAYFTESYLFRSLLSIILIERGGDTVYIPESSLEKIANDETVYMISVGELRPLLDNLSELADFVRPLVAYDDEEGEEEPEDDIEALSDEDEEGEEPDEGEDPGEGPGEDPSEESRRARIAIIAEALRKDNFAALVETNRIFEGTVSLFLLDLIRYNPYVVIPLRLMESVDEWVTTGASYSRRNGELRNLLDALSVANVELDELFGGEFGINAFFQMLVSDDTETAEGLLASDILYYTLSKNLFKDGMSTGGVQIIVPNVALSKTPENDTLEYTVKKSELLKLFAALSELGFEQEMDTSALLYKIVSHKKVFDSSTIMAATIVHLIVNENTGITAVLSMPEEYIKAGGKEAAEDYNSSNVWKAELPRFIDALDEMLGISRQKGDFRFNESGIKSGLSELITGYSDDSTVKPGLSKLKVCYLSEIIRSVITARLDDALEDSVDETVRNSAKSHGYYQESELEAFFCALNEMNVISIDGLKNFSPWLLGDLSGPSKLDPTKTRLEVIFASRLARGMIASIF